MKKIYLFTIILANIFNVINIKAKDEKSFGNAPADYNFEKGLKRALESHGKILDDVIYFSDNIGDLDKKPEKIMLQKTTVENTLALEIDRLQSIEASEDKVMIDSVIAYYTHLKNSITTEYDVAINLRLNMELTHAHIHSFLTLLEKADENILISEEHLFAMETKYAKAHKFKVSAEEVEIRKKVQLNDKVIKYHNKMFLEFYKIYSAENDYIETQITVNQMSSKVKKDSVLKESRKKFANELFLADENLNAIGNFNGDASLHSNIKAYYHYIRSENFKNPDFFNEYVLNIEKKHGKVTDNTDSKKHEHVLHAAQSKLVTQKIRIDSKKEKESSKYTKRELLLEHVEQASYKFLYEHSPVFH